MYNYIKVLKLYALVLLAAVVGNSCCEENFRITGNGSIQAIDFETGETYFDPVVGVITGSFDIWVQHEVSTIASVGSGLINAAYATQCGEFFENNLDAGTLVVTANRDFTYDGQVISAGSNLIEITDLDYQVDFGNVEVRFSEEFVSKMVVIDEVYQFKVEISSTDGLDLENSINLEFSLNQD